MMASSVMRHLQHSLLHGAHCSGAVPTCGARCFLLPLLMCLSVLLRLLPSPQLPPTGPRSRLHGWADSDRCWCMPGTWLVCDLEHVRTIVQQRRQALAALQHDKRRDIREQHLGTCGCTNLAGAQC
jgi:hypothetical protein